MKLQAYLNKTNIIPKRVGCQDNGCGQYGINQTWTSLYLSWTCLLQLLFDVTRRSCRELQVINEQKF